MDISSILYPNGLVPAAHNVNHGYKNYWFRDGYFDGICSQPSVRNAIWNGTIDILDRYKWKLEIHAKVPPKHWYEHIHVRYNPEGLEIGNEPWQHHQWESVANAGEMALDKGRTDLAGLIVDYLDTAKCHRAPSAGAWEDRNNSDAYSLAACAHFFQKCKPSLNGRYDQLDQSVRMCTKRLYSLLPYATEKKQVCLSILGVIWPYHAAGPYKQEIIDIVKSTLMREPFGFIRYVGDKYDGEGFSRGKGSELPWLLGDCFMCKIEPNNPIWRKRLQAAQDHFGCMPEAFFPETMKMNRNSPLVWAESMWNSIKNEV